jgi:hypothetical protein
VQKDKSPIRRFIDSSILLRTLPVWKYSTETISKHDSANASYYSDKRVDIAASLVITIIGAFMLITPIWILQALEHLPMKPVVISLFVLACILILSFAMVAKPFEALGASAA